MDRHFHKWVRKGDVFVCVSDSGPGVGPPCKFYLPDQDALVTRINYLEKFHAFCVGLKRGEGTYNELYLLFDDETEKSPENSV